MDSRIFPWIFCLALIFWRVRGDPVEDKRALLDFLSILRPARALNWDEASPVCDHWIGVTCSDDKSSVVAVRLPAVGFNGPIPPNTLSRLSSLQTLSLRSNIITGGFPSDFVNLKNLAYLYLQHNNLSGPLPLDFSVWKNLIVVNLSENRFNGSIPASISNVTQLQELILANNSLAGDIPDLDLPSLQHIDLSYNELTGNIPDSLRKFPVSNFAGNKITFATTGPPISQPHGKPKSRFLGLNQTGFILIVVSGCVLLIIAFAFMVGVCCMRKKTRELEGLPERMTKGHMSPEKVVSRMEDANNRLNFFEGCNYAFDLEDLLRASAEVLGKGTFGTTYKAVLEDATAVVVKRLKDVAVGKKDFEQQMEIVGAIRHENVVELKAYYYSKDEKLMVYDYISQGSVSALLHGNRGENRTPMDWDARMRIAIGAACGIARIHEENNGKLVHGNVKSSNIFLNSKRYGCVSDLGLTTVMSSLALPVSRAAGYRAPEIADTRKSSQGSDVYSFGVVLLELLTGKSPIHTTAGDETVHLVRWVHSVVREEWTAEVFDIELLRCPNIEEEMVEMLQIAMSCVARVPDRRPKMPELVKMLEGVRRMDPESQPASTTSPLPPPSASG